MISVTAYDKLPPNGTHLILDVCARLVYSKPCRTIFVSSDGTFLDLHSLHFTGFMINNYLKVNRTRVVLLIKLLWLSSFVVACTPAPEANVISYLAAKQFGTLTLPPSPLPGGMLTGLVFYNGEPVAGATVLVAERTGTPHSAQTDAQGRYQIVDIPPGQYVPAAVAPGFEESALTDWFGFPGLVTIRPGALTTAPTFTLKRHTPKPLPQSLALATNLVLTTTTVTTASFPAGAMAQVQAYQFEYAGAQIDTLRVYLPISVTAEAKLPVLFMVYPTDVDLWSAVSTAYAAQGYAMVAMSPIAARGVDIDAHADDARVALTLARQGALGSNIDSRKVVALGGSFSSAIMHRLLADVTATGDGAIAGWVTVGGISNALSGTADFYAGRLEIPPRYEYLIPALGNPQYYPLPFLRFSPVYTAAQLPPTLIIHTAVDLVTPIDQAYQLEAALRAANVPVEVFYYQDVSHYLQIDANMTDEARAMFYLAAEFADRMLRE